MDFQFLIIYNILLLFSLSKYVGYIDPGSLTVIIAMVIGALVGTGMTIKLYWMKLKNKFSGKTD